MITHYYYQMMAGQPMMQQMYQPMPGQHQMAAGSALCVYIHIYIYIYIYTYTYIYIYIYSGRNLRPNFSTASSAAEIFRRLRFWGVPFVTCLYLHAPLVGNAYACACA